MIAAFFGHKDFYCSDEERSKIGKMLEKCVIAGFNEFLCGGYSEFDYFAFQVLKQLKSKYDIKISYVTPYISGYRLECAKSNSYDEIVYPSLENVPPRYAIIKRNEYMGSH